MTVPELFPGRIIAGKFTVQSTLRRSPWAATHRAITSPNREVVIKVFDTALAARPEVLVAIQRAEMAGAALPAHMALPVIEQGVDAELAVPYIVTPRAATPSLAQLVDLCALSARETVSLLSNLGRALDAAHFAGYAHLALKPTNIFVGPSPIYNVQVCDFGANATRALVDEETRLAFCAPWLAPEQLAGDEKAGPEADVFAAALVAFFAMTGRSLWRSCRGATPDLAAYRAEVQKPPPRASEVAGEMGCVLDAAFNDVFAGALGGPEGRPKSVSAFAEQLAAALGTSSIAPAPLESNVVATAISLPPDAIEPEQASDRPGPAPAQSLRIPTLSPPSGTSMPPVPPPPDPAADTLGPVLAPPPSSFGRLQTVPYWNELAQQKGDWPPPPPAPDAPPLQPAPPAPAYAPPALPTTHVQTPSVVIAVPAPGAPVAAQDAPRPPRAPLPTLASKRVMRRPWIAAGIGVALGAAFGLAAFSHARLASLFARPAQAESPSAEPGDSARAVPVAAASSPPSSSPVAAAPPPVVPSAAPAPTAVAAIAGDASLPDPTNAAAPGAGVPLYGHPRPDDAELTIVCEPTCDLIAIDSHTAAGYPRPILLRPGVHGVGASRAHYGGQWKQVTVGPGEKAQVTFKLTPQADTPPAKKPCGHFLKRCKD